MACERLKADIIQTFYGSKHSATGRVPLSFDTEIQGLFKDFQGPSNFIFKDQFSMEVYSMSSRTAIFNVYLCDDVTVIR